MSFVERRRALIKEGEGCVPYMYLDTKGYVTVGVGHMMRDVAAAQKLAFVRRDSGAPATLGEIAADFARVKGQPFGQSITHRAFRSHTKLILPDDRIDALLSRRIAGFENGLKRNFANYEAYPDRVKLGLMDMAFNLGTRGLVTKFPSFTRAARAGDWAGCARECRRRGISSERNETVRRLFEEEFQDG